MERWTEPWLRYRQGKSQSLRSTQSNYVKGEELIFGNKKLWFSHATRLVVRYSTIGASALVAHGGTSNARERPCLEVEVEAQNAGERLRSALKVALQRKVGVQNCFRHFDVENVGYCGAGGDGKAITSATLGYCGAGGDGKAIT